jgi:transposase
MHHWTEHNIRVHVFTCVLALQIAHLMRHRPKQLAGIQETVLLYQGQRGRPKARRMPTQTNPAQDQLSKIFALDRYAPHQ